MKITKPCFIFNQITNLTLSWYSVFLDPENVCLDTKIMILSGLEAEIVIDICFYMVAILKIQDGRHDVFRGSGSYHQWKAKAMGSMWRKFSAFVQNVHIHLLSCLTSVQSAYDMPYSVHLVLYYVALKLCITQFSIMWPMSLMQVHGGAHLEAFLGCYKRS
jgi:hypothetical protein